MKENIKSIVRHTLTGLGGVLIARGVATPEAVDSVASGAAEIVAGGVTFMLGLGFSLLRNSKLGKFLK